MDLRKTLGVLAVFLLVVGVTGVAQALTPVASTDVGVYVRIANPATGVQAKIGDTIRVNVTTYKEAFDTMYVALLIDTSATAGEAKTFSARAGLAKKLTSGASGKFMGLICLTSPTDSTAGSYIWRLKIGVAAGDTAISASGSLKGAAIFRKASGSGFRKLKNDQTGDQIDTGSDALSTTAVGDGVVVGIDGSRVVSTAVLDSVQSRQAGPFKKGDALPINLQIDLSQFLAAGASEARVAIIRNDLGVSSDSFLDSALAVKGAQYITVSKATLLSSGGTYNDTLVVGTDVTFTDNFRFTFVAVLADAAGNLSASTSSASTAEGFTSRVTYIGDSVSPTKKLYYLVDNKNAALVSGARLSSAKAQSKSIRLETTGAFGTVNYDSTLQPLKLTASEDIDSVYVKFGDSTNVASNGVAFSKNDTVAIVIPATFGLAAKAGTSKDLVVTVVDSVGNRTATTVTGVTLDAVAPTISDQFPTASNTPKDASGVPTITDATKDVKFKSNEKLREARVRYIAVGEATPEVKKQALTAGNAQLESVDADILVDVSQTLSDKKYTLDGIVFDLAGNVSTFGPDTLTFDADFANPEADSFTVDAALDTIIASQSNLVTIKAVDSDITGSPTAVTYAKDVTVSGTDASGAAITSLVYSGATGVVTDNGDGTATIDGDGWLVGATSITIQSDTAIPLFHIHVQETSASGDSTVVEISGLDDSLAVDAAEMAAYKVTAEEGGTVTTEVSEDFQLTVVPTDAYGNASTKTRVSNNGTNSLAVTDSTGLTDARIKDDLVLNEVFVVISTNNGAAHAPQGPQAVGSDGATFTVVAPNGTGDLWVGVKTHNASSDVSGSAGSSAATLQKYLDATGSVSVGFIPFGEEPTTGPAGAPDAPGSIIAQDYMGAEGEGDQGQMMLISFTSSATEGVTSYVIDRELMVTTGIVDGALVELDDEVAQWVAWAQVTAVAAAGDDDVNRVVVPVPGGGGSKWGVRAVKGGEASDRTGSVAGKRVFTKESVQQVVDLLGLKVDGVLSREELLKQFNAPKDYVKSILGDQKGIQFASLNPDVSAILGKQANVPSSIRTAGHSGNVSTRTATEEAVAPVDNIAPAAVTGAEGSRVVDGSDLNWTASVDDKVVGSVDYRGYSLPIAGVEKYQILRGTSEDDLAVIATVGKGQTTFEDRDLPDGASALVYRVDALDLDNTAIGQVFKVFGETRVEELADDGLPIYRMVLDGTPEVDFEDFVAFAQSYDAAPGDENFNPQADTNDDGAVDFGDFIRFAQRYGQVANVPAGKRVVAPSRPGVNTNTELSLNLTSDRVLVGQNINVTISAANAEALLGYGLVVSYDTDKFEFVDAQPADTDLLKSAGGETPLFRHWMESGEITIANAVVNSQAVSGDGELVTLTFKVLREFEENARFEIGQGIVFDSEQLSNPAVILGALSVESTPTEFALNQNFPNPFNPETTIKYQLAEGTNVSLRIYNIVGQVVATLVNESQSAGRYQVRWSGTDDRGATVSSGIYFYQLTAGQFQDVKRLMLLK